MVDQRNDDNLLLILLAVILAGDVDEPIAYELLHRLGRSGRLREQLGPDFDYFLERGLLGRRPRRREELREVVSSLVEGLRSGFEQQTQALSTAFVSARPHADER